MYKFKKLLKPLSLSVLVSIFIVVSAVLFEMFICFLFGLSSSSTTLVVSFVIAMLAFAIILPNHSPISMSIEIEVDGEMWSGNDDRKDNY